MRRVTTMDKRKLVCNIATGAAFVVWPWIWLAGIALVIFVSISVLSWLGAHTHFHSGKVAEWIFLGVVGISMYIVNGLRAAEWVRERCSPDNGPTEPRS